MALNNLYMRYGYPKNGTNLPLLVIVHGWDGQAYGDEMIDYYSQQGFFTISVGMRGRNGAEGLRDASGRETYDVHDAVKKIRAEYSYLLSDKNNLFGWSGGGGTVLAMACKFPDYYNCIGAYYGMSDYGYSATTSWGITNPDFKNSIEASVGATVGIQDKRYRSRYAVSGIKNYDGRLFLFHHDPDGYVAPIHTQNIVASMQAAGKTNYDVYYSTPSDTYQFTHGFGFNTPSQQYANGLVLPVMKTAPTLIIPTTGTREVGGFLETKRFSIWLDDGRSSAANVNYNTITKTYIITPITSGNIAVRIEQGGTIVSQTISSQTTITL